MINQSVIVGRLTKNPELEFFPSGKAKTMFTLASNRNYKNKNNEHDTDFIPCIMWDKQAEVLANNASKGTLIGVVGRIETDKYQNANNETVYTMYLVCESFQFLESKECTQKRKQQANPMQQQEPPTHTDMYSEYL